MLILNYYGDFVYPREDKNIIINGVFLQSQFLFINFRYNPKILYETIETAWIIEQ